MIAQAQEAGTTGHTVISPGRTDRTRRCGAIVTPPVMELTLVALLLAAVGAAAYGAYVAHGGFYSDDWSDLAGYHFAGSPKFWTDVSDLHRTLGGRPMLALLLPIPNALFGSHPAPYLGLAAGLGVLSSWCFYLLLRTLTMRPAPAVAIAILTLLFPWSDSIRLWPTASMTTLSVCFLCLGVVVALHGLRRHGAAAIVMHAGAAALYLMSVLTYEATGAAALLAGALYIGRAPARSVARRWLVDVVVVIAGLTFSLVNTVASRPVGSPSARLSDVPHFVRQALALLVSGIIPPASSRILQAVVLLAIGLTLTLAVIRLRRRADPELAPWLGWCAVAVVMIAATYFMFLGSHLHPNDPGIDNRTNILAGFGYALFAYAIVALAAHLLIPGSPLATAGPLAAAGLIAVGYAVHLHDDQTDWRRAAGLQAGILSSIAGNVPRLPPGGTLVSFDVTDQAAPEVPVFKDKDDFSGALRLQRNDASLTGYPVYPGITVRCGRRVATVTGAGDYGTHTARYGHLFFLRAATGRSARIPSRRACAAALLSVS